MDSYHLVMIIFISFITVMWLILSYIGKQLDMKQQAVISDIQVNQTEGEFLQKTPLQQSPSTFIKKPESKLNYENKTEGAERYFRKNNSKSFTDAQLQKVQKSQQEFSQENENSEDQTKIHSLKNIQQDSDNNDQIVDFFKIFQQIQTPSKVELNLKVMRDSALKTVAEELEDFSPQKARISKLPQTLYMFNHLDKTESLNCSVDKQNNQDTPGKNSYAQSDRLQTNPESNSNQQQNYEINNKPSYFATKRRSQKTQMSDGNESQVNLDIEENQPLTQRIQIKSRKSIIILPNGQSCISYRLPERGKQRRKTKIISSESPTSPMCESSLKVLNSCTSLQIPQKQATSCLLVTEPTPLKPDLYRKRQKIFKKYIFREVMTENILFKVFSNYNPRIQRSYKLTQIYIRSMQVHSFICLSLSNDLDIKYSALFIFGIAIIIVALKRAIDTQLLGQIKKFNSPKQSQKRPIIYAILLLNGIELLISQGIVISYLIVSNQFKKWFLFSLPATFSDILIFDIIKFIFYCLGKDEHKLVDRTQKQ